MRIDKLFETAASRLTEAGIDNARLDASLLLAFVLKKDRGYILCHPEQIIEDAQASSFNELVQRRAGREPLSHIVGRREFWSLEFEVTKDTLDPRPDSETLIEAVLDIYKDKNKPLRILDLGTGTGCLLLSLLFEYNSATGVGVDASLAALNVAKRNASNLNLSNRAEFVISNWTDNVSGEFDIVISNPPYIETAAIDRLQQEVRNHEPNAALDGGLDGLDCYRAILAKLNSVLKDSGVAVFEIGIGQDEALINLAKDSGFMCIKTKRDLAGVTRCLVFS